jgi:hypothetical protein
MTVAEVTTAQEQRAGAVLEWRFSQLTRSGYGVVDALALAARPDVDLHRATDLVARGCSPSVALRILL